MKKINCDPSTILEQYLKLNIPLGSCEITLDSNGKKNLNFFGHKNWSSPLDETKNGFFYKTGPENGICCLDFDSLDNDTAIELKSIADKCCGLVEQTYKGFHYIFKFNTKFSNKRHLHKYGIDFLSSGSIVLCPPSYYKLQTGAIFRYTLLKCDNLTSMSDELVNKLDILFKKNSPHPKNINFENRLIINQKVRHNIFNPLDYNEMTELLAQIDQVHSDDYLDWIITGMALKSSNYDIPLWITFSKRSDKYEEGECAYLWDKLDSNMITTGTLVHWLKNENTSIYKKIFLNKKLKKYDGDIIISSDEIFSKEKMFDLWDEDISELGDDIYLKHHPLTKSFKYFNHFHVYIAEIDCSGIIDNGKFCLLPSIFNYYSNIHKDNFKFINIWKSSRFKREYLKIGFFPNIKCPVTIFNEFNGFKFENNDYTVNLNLIRPFLDHFEYISNGNQEIYNYILNWVSHIRQFPSQKTGTAIVLFSDTHGTGKNTLVDIISKIFFGYSSPIRELDIDSKFNKIFQSKLFIWGDEISGQSKYNSDNLKDIITRNIIKIEPKGKESYIIDDYSNFIFTTNHSGSFKIDIHDRRLVLVHCTEIKRDPDYYFNLHKLLNYPLILQEFDKFCKTRDLFNVNIKNIIKTDYRHELIEHSLSGFILMFKYEAFKFSDNIFNLHDLYILFQEYAKKNKLQFVSITELQMSRSLRKFFGNYRKKINLGIIYEFPKNFDSVVDLIINNSI